MAKYKPSLQRLLSTLFVVLLLGTAITADAAPAFVLRAETSTEKFFPWSFKDRWQKPGAGDTVRIGACRGESESFQVIVLPWQGLTNLRWRVASASLDPACFHVTPVGYVNIPKTTKPARYVVQPREEIFTGLWPDPLLGWDALPQVESNRLQSLWVTVDVPWPLKGGNYPFTIGVRADGTDEASIAGELRVWNFALPPRMSLKTSFWCQMRDFKAYYPEMTNQWEVAERFVRAALDHRITPVILEPLLADVIFEPESGQYTFNFDAWKRYAQVLRTHPRQGNVVCLMNSGFIQPMLWGIKLKECGAVRPMQGGPFTRKANTLGHEDLANQYLPAVRQAAAEAGVLDLAYFSPHDEPADDAETVTFVATMRRLIRRHFPDAPIVMPLNYTPSVTAFKPYVDVLTLSFFDVFVAAKLPEWERTIREPGRHTWGYVCGKTADIDYQSIHHRVWPWICWKYGLEGFLYWGITFWDDNCDQPANAHLRKQLLRASPAERWPLAAEWRTPLIESGNPGDGYLLYPSPDGKPWNSIRLENIRDGIEDYEYFCILRQAMTDLGKRRPSREVRALLRAGRELLTIPESLIKAPETYATDPALYLARREAVAELIERMLRQIERKEE